MKVIVHPAATTDLTGAATFYAAKANQELGQALIVEFERTIQLVSENPELGIEWLPGTRRITLRRFPFSVVYRLSPDHIFIIAVAHQRRRPGYWRQRN
ncbi:MAG: type II toxin-antitoxin system RelE/ParE family toxin [Pseudomonadota bacterium]|nr:type II toxin-antitoxin system RelE/ParE family toxin [Pseudomonadota bacterium]